MNRKYTPAAIGRITATAALAASLIAPSAAFAKPVRLFVDPGHGGKDPGAVSGGVLEKDAALSISKMVIKDAKRQGWSVRASRRTDKFIDLNERAARANAWKADAFVSVHSNSAGNKKVGHMTIYRSKGGNRLGKRIMKELNPLTSYKDIGNRSDVRGLAVLRGTQMPSVIVELLSVSSKAERKVLTDKGEQRKMAEAIVRGVAKSEGVKYRPAKPKAAKKAKAEKPRVTEPTATPKTEPTPAPKVEPKPAPQAEPTEAPRPTPAPAAEPTPAPSAGIFGSLLKLLFG